MMTALSERQITAILLIFCGIVFLVLGFLFTARVIWKLPWAQSEVHLRVERGIVIAAFLINVMGFVLLEGVLRDAGDRAIVRLALTLYVIAAAVLVVAEMAYVDKRTWVYPQIVAHVVLAFLAQAAFGASLLRTELTASWAGWAAIRWNIGLLIIMPIFDPRDIYFPWLHYVAPLMIGGIALLARR